MQDSGGGGSVSQVKKVEKKEAAHEAPAQKTSAAPVTSKASARARGGGSSSPAQSEATPARHETPARRDESSGNGSRTSSDSSHGDRVQVSREEEESSPFLPAFLRRLGEEDRPPPPHEELEDGTVIDRQDGRTTTREPDGTVSVEYRDGDRQITETSYEKDGAQVSEREVRFDNGDVRTVSEVERDGQVERTVSNTTNSDRDIESYQCGVPGTDTELARIGDRDQTEVTQVTRTITDTSKQPPETRTVLERTTYSQHIPLGDADPGDAGLSDDTRYVDGGRGRRGAQYPDQDTLEGVDIDRRQSGQTLALSTTTTYDGNGKPHVTQESASTSTIVGVGEDGQEVRVAEGHARTDVDGKVREVDSREIRGVLTKGDGRIGLDHVGSVTDKDDYYDRLPDGTVNFRQTEVYNVDGDERHLEARTQEYGDYDRPDSAGRTVTITEDDNKKFWTYRRIDDTDTGIRVRSQTGVEGSEGYIVSDATQNRDGTYHSETDFYDNDGVKIRSELRERVLVEDPQEALSREGLYFGDAGYAREFLRENEGRPIYRETVRVVDEKDDYDGSFKSQRFTAEGSDQALTNVFRLEDSSNTTIYEDPGSDTPSRVKVDGGPEFSVTKDGRTWVTDSGERVEIPHAEIPGVPEEGGTEAPAALESASGSTRHLYASIRKLATREEAAEFLELHPRLGAAAGAASTAIGALSLYTGIKEGDAGDILQGGSTLAAGLGEISALGSKALEASRLGEALGIGGKVLGGAGAVLGAAYGGYQISQGDTVGGIFSLTAAGGAGIAVGAGIAGTTGWVPVAGWVVAGVAIAGGFIYDLWRSDQEAHKTHELQF